MLHESVFLSLVVRSMLTASGCEDNEPSETIQLVSAKAREH